MQNKKTISALYKAGEKPFGDEPPEYFKEALTYIQNGTVLDLGGGYGRFSLFLAKKGLQVTNVDVSEEAIQAFTTKLQELQLSANALVKDLRNFTFESNYNHILCITSLHLLQKSSALQLLNEMRKHTTPKGIHFIAGFTKEHNQLFSDKNAVNNGLLEYYMDWEILYFKKFIVTNISKEKVPYFILVAQKPDQF